MTTKNRVFRLVLSLVLTVLSLVVVSAPSASAIEVSLNAVPVWSNYSPDMCFWTTQQTNCYTNSYINGNNDVTISIYQVSMTLPQGLNVTSGKTVAVFNMVLDNFQDNNSIDGVFLYERVLAGDGWGLLDTKAFSQGSGSYRIQITLIAENTYTSQGGYQIELKNAYNAAELAFLKPGERISAAGASFYYIEGSGTDAIVNAINNSSDTQAINDAKREIVGAIEEQQQTQQDIHDDEKDTIQDSVDEAENTADGMSFGFNLANPFLNWFALFNDNACVSIPTLHDWLHSTDTQVCSPWRNTSVRSVLTPIFALLGTMLVTGFVLRWLSRNNTEGTIEGI